MKITLKQHEGQIKTGDTITTVKHPQDMVFRDGICIGYIAHRDGATFCPLAAMDEAEVNPILRQIAALRKGVFTAPAGIAEPPMDASKIEDELAKATMAEDDNEEDDDE